MKIDTTRFGLIELPDEAVIHFPRGLYGLEKARSYCMLKHDEPGRFQWLQATDAPAIAMVVTDPFLFFPSYEVEIPDSDAELLQASASSDVTIYTRAPADLREPAGSTGHQSSRGRGHAVDPGRCPLRHAPPVWRKR